MNHRVRQPWARAGTLLAAGLAIALVARTGSTSAQESKPAARPAPNSASEPFATAASMPRAAAFLDEVASSWTKQHSCGTCHTNYPYLVARPALKEHPSPAMAEVRRFFEDRVVHWDDSEKRAHPPPNLHHATMLLWASTRLEGLMTAEQRGSTIARLRDYQRADGGWSLPSLGHWTRRDGTPNDPRVPSDGYATGLAVFVLRQAGGPTSDPAIQRGIAWLRSHQRASGRWFNRSVNNDKHHYITHAGTAFAVLALEAGGDPNNVFRPETHEP